MIVRDNEAILGPCLASAMPWVDETIVLDTGSVDATADVARRCGARVESFGWVDDFSAARNASISFARGEWIFWMDSDDVLSVDNGAQLRSLSATAHPADVLGFVMQVHCPTEDGETTVVDHVKVFRNRPDLRFEGRIHEQILPSIRRAGGTVAWTDLFVTHAMSDRTPEGTRRKFERDLRILHLDLRERPDHPFVLFNLGMTYGEKGDHAQAAQWLRRCLERSTVEESHVPKAYALLINALSATDRLESAAEVATRALELYPVDKEILFRLASVRHRQGSLSEARRGYLDVLLKRSERRFASVDVELDRYKTHHNLAIVCQELGDVRAAEFHWREAIAASPRRRYAREALLDHQVRMGRAFSIDAEADRLSNAGSEVEAALWRSAAAQARGEWERAIDSLEELLQEHEEASALRRLADVCLKAGAKLKALRACDRLTELDPEDASAWHNLGALRYEHGDVAGAAEALERSLDIRPGYSLTRELLALVRGASEAPAESVIAEMF